MRSPRVVLALLSMTLFYPACGGRSDLYVRPPGPPEPECDGHSDCPGFDDFCAPARCLVTKGNEDLLPDPPAGTVLPPRVCLILNEVVCEDDDPCTKDVCDSELDSCTHGPATLDLDDDGHRAPLPGKSPGAIDACGDDCDDSSALAFPGNTELCDGVDNDCNGVVDDGASYTPLMGEVRVSSQSIAPAGPGGLAYGVDSYMSIYSGGSSGFQMYETRLLPDGTKIAPIEESFTFQNGDSSGGPIHWIGDRFGVAWQDRRDGDYETYFTLLDKDGTKLIADTRLTNALGFSINVDMTWNGDEFIVAWQDERSGLFEIMAQRVSVNGIPIDGNVSLTNAGGLAEESPALASGIETLGLAYVSGDPSQSTVRFRSFAHTTLEPQSEFVALTNSSSKPSYPRIIWNEDRYIITWFEDGAGLDRAIFAISVAESGEVITPVTQISFPGGFRSRYPRLLPLGDRALFVYSDTRDGGDYELYTRMVDAELQPMSPEQRLTNAPAPSIHPVITFGSDGDVGVLFRDDREGTHDVWFTRLGCVVGG